MNLLPLRRLELWEPLRQLQREMDQVMQRFVGDASEESTPLAAWVPRADVEEDEKQYVIKVDLPGVDPKDVEVSVADSSLVLRGQRKMEREDKKRNYHRIERFEGQFYREVPLPRGTDLEKIQATSSKGVLTITIPKKAEAQPKKILVQAEK